MLVIPLLSQDERWQEVGMARATGPLLESREIAKDSTVLFPQASHPTHDMSGMIRPRLGWGQELWLYPSPALRHWTNHLLPGVGVPVYVFLHRSEITVGSSPQTSVY